MDMNVDPASAGKKRIVKKTKVKRRKISEQSPREEPSTVAAVVDVNPDPIQGQNQSMVEEGYENLDGEKQHIEKNIYRQAY